MGERKRQTKNGEKEKNEEKKETKVWGEMRRQKREKRKKEYDIPQQTKVESDKSNTDLFELKHTT
jgi:hypothetical protein